MRTSGNFTSDWHKCRHLPPNPINPTRSASFAPRTRAAAAPAAAVVNEEVMNFRRVVVLRGDMIGIPST
jgi:hypothetical protein